MKEMWLYKEGVHPRVWKEIGRNNDMEIGLRVQGHETIMDLLRWMAGEGWFESNTKARNLLEGGGVSINEKKMKYNDKIEIRGGELLKVGNVEFRVFNY